MEIIPAITDTTFVEMALYALDTNIAMSRYALFNFVRFQLVAKVAIQAGTPNRFIDEDIKASRRLLLLLGPSLLGIILATALMSFAAFPDT